MRSRYTKKKVGKFPLVFLLFCYYYCHTKVPQVLKYRYRYINSRKQSVNFSPQKRKTGRKKKMLSIASRKTTAPALTNQHTKGGGGGEGSHAQRSKVLKSRAVADVMIILSKPYA